MSAPATPVETALRALAKGESLTRAHASEVMELVMGGEVPAAQLGGLLVGLLVKGESVEEIAGLATVMRARSVPVRVAGTVVDTCGTGGDGSDSFNVSTVAAFVVAAAGATVAKHGNRAMSSSCGSADVLEELGAAVELDAPQVERVLAACGIGFMFAPRFHPAMRHVASVRRELRMRTVFNILGPLTNPAGATRQVIGVADAAIAEKMALVLGELGSEHALVVRGRDGLDELSIATVSVVYELHRGQVRRYEVTPEELGVQRASADELRGGSRAANATIARQVLSGASGACRDVVALNAGAALYVAGHAQSIADGVVLAQAAIDDGGGARTLACFVDATTHAAGEAA